MATKAIITSAQNFSDLDNPRIYYENPSKVPVEAAIFYGNNEMLISYRSIPTTGTEYIFNLTEAERESLRKRCIDSVSMGVRFYVRSTIDGKYQYSYVARVLSIEDCIPEITAASVTDTNPYSVALTNNNSIMVFNMSMPSVAYTAKLKKYATIKSITIKNGNSKLTRGEGYVLNPVTLPFAAQRGVFEIEITDSRGHTASYTALNDFVSYFRPSCEISVSVSPTGEANVEIQGMYYSGSFGAVSNSLQLMCKYSDTGEFTDNDSYFVIENNFTSSTDNFTYTAQTSGLDYQKTYTFQAYIKDKANNTFYAYATSSNMPIFDWGKDDFKFNVPVYFPSGNYGIYGNNGEYNMLGVYAGALRVGDINYMETDLAGNYVAIQAENVLSMNGSQVYINGCRAGAQNILNTDNINKFMNASQSYTLTGNKMLSKQLNGYILCWSSYNNGAVDDNFVYTYVPKRMLSINSEIVLPFTTKAGNSGVKILNITETATETAIKGDDLNSSGNNKLLCLRYIIGY